MASSNVIPFRRRAENSSAQALYKLALQPEVDVYAVFRAVEQALDVYPDVPDASQLWSIIDFGEMTARYMASKPALGNALVGLLMEKTKEDYAIALFYVGFCGLDVIKQFHGDAPKPKF